jgi:epidermal growth factor receptor kinase substrate 8
LNRCFDEIERFVARIQQAAIAQRELEARRNRGKRPGDGILQMRAQLPGEREFVDILQKFKLSFNLLVKIQAFFSFFWSKFRLFSNLFIF